MVRVRGISNKRAMPTTKKIGRKTTTVVTVDAKNRHGHLAGRFQDRVPAAGRGVEMALNILQFDDGIVDEPADPERQSSQGEDVQGLPGEVQYDERHHDREGNGDGNDQRARKITEENQDDRLRPAAIRAAPAR